MKPTTATMPNPADRTPENPSILLSASEASDLASAFSDKKELHKALAVKGWHDITIIGDQILLTARFSRKEGELLPPIEAPTSMASQTSGTQSSNKKDISDHFSSGKKRYILE